MSAGGGIWLYSALTMIKASDLLNFCWMALIFFGTDLVGDQSELRMLDMADIDGSDNIRVICKYTAGTQIGIGSEIAYLS